MSWIDGLKHRARTLFNPSAYDREMDDEFKHHLELGAQSAGDRDAARRQFGNRTYHKEGARLATWLAWFDVLQQDARYAWRSLTRTPSFTAMVIVTLALGIGANGALFSFLDRLFVRMPAGVDKPSELRRVWVDAFGGPGGRQIIYAVGYPTYQALREAGEGKANVALYVAGNTRWYLGRNRTPPGIAGEFATSNFFQVLGVRPALGRFFAADEDIMGSPVNVAVLSHDYWQRGFKADSAIIGRSIEIGLRPFTVIGVAPAGFRGLDNQAADMWAPLATLQGRKQGGKEWWEGRTTYGARAVVRPMPTLDADAFVARATVIMRRTEMANDPRFGDSLYAARLGSIVEARGPGNLTQDVVMATRLGGVALVVLLIAFANVVGLLLARAMTRHREIALRLALGISRARLARMLTTETLLLALVAGGAAILVSSWGGKVLRSLLMPNVVFTDSPVDARVVVFTLGVAVLAGLLAGIVPALQATRIQLGGLKDVAVGQGRAHSRLRSSFVVTQAAFSVVLVVVGVLFVRSFQNILAVPLGVDSDRLVFASVGFETGEAPADTVRSRLLRAVATRIEGRAGFDAVARSSSTPMRGMSYSSAYADGDSTRNFGNEGASMTAVSTGYFRAMGLRVLSGVTFSGDEATSPSQEAVINARMARLYWPGKDPIGHCLNIESPTGPCFRVVGVVDQQQRMNLIEKQSAQYYLPLGYVGANRGFHSATSIIVRTRPENRARLIQELQSTLKQEFPLGYPYVRMMSENLAAEYRPWRVGASLFGAFAVLALLVALVGIYSSVAYGVGRRTREFGVRIALGAHARDVVNLVVGEGLRTVAIGVALGVVLALAAGRLLASMLFGVEPSDLSAMMLSACGLLLVASAAAMIPAWRAARVDPTVALRAE